jgi:hypothetical protein
VIASLSLLAALIVSSDVIACPSAGSSSTIFFENLPSRIDAPVAAKITVIRLQNKGRQHAYEAVARVETVITGSIPSRLITLISPGMDCDKPLSVGDSGIVLGSVRQTGPNAFELIAVSETLDQRRAREQAK